MPLTRREIWRQGKIANFYIVDRARTARRLHESVGGEARASSRERALCHIARPATAAVSVIAAEPAIPFTTSRGDSLLWALRLGARQLR